MRALMIYTKNELVQAERSVCYRYRCIIKYFVKLWLGIGGLVMLAEVKIYVRNSLHGAQRYPPRTRELAGEPRGTEDLFSLGVLTRGFRADHHAPWRRTTLFKMQIQPRKTPRWATGREREAGGQAHALVRAAFTGEGAHAHGQVWLIHIKDSLNLSYIR